MAEHTHPAGEGNTPRTEERERGRAIAVALGEALQLLREVDQMARTFERKVGRLGSGLVCSLEARIDTGRRAIEAERDPARRAKLEQAVRDLELERSEAIEALEGGYRGSEAAERVAQALKESGGVWDGGPAPRTMHKR